MSDSRSVSRGYLPRTPAAAPSTVSPQMAPRPFEADDLSPSTTGEAPSLHNFSNVAVTAPVQAKLTVGQPGDPYEQEADRIADQVMTMPDPGHAQVQRMQESEEEELQMKPLGESIQRLANGEEEDELQVKPLGGSIQRMEIPEEEELQMKPLGDGIQRMEIPEEEEIQMKAADASAQVASPNLETSLNQSKGGGAALDDATRSFIEPRMGFDFSQVRIHNDSQAVQMNEQLGARAFTHGSDVYFGAGQYNPGSDDGKRLLSHELTHVVQQTTDDSIQRDCDVDESCAGETASGEDSAAIALVCSELPELVEQEPALRNYDASLVEETRERYRIPSRGWTDIRPADGATRRIDLSASVRTLINRIRTNPEIVTHIRETLDMFYRDSDARSRLTPEDIDLPLIIAIANRESAGSPILFSTSDERVITAGPDTHRQGRGGLDYVGSRRSYFPSDIRDQVVAVQDSRQLRTGLRPNRQSANPAELRERDLLAAYIVEVRSRTERFERIYRQRASSFLKPEQVERLLENLNTDARRAWVQASFGSRLPQILRDVLNRFRQAMRRSRAEDKFSDVLENDQFNLNAISENDQIIEAQGLSGHRIRITTAEAHLFEQTLPSTLSEGMVREESDNTLAEGLECVEPEELISR